MGNLKEKDLVVLDNGVTKKKAMLQLRIHMIWQSSDQHENH